MRLGSDRRLSCHGLARSGLLNAHAARFPLPGRVRRQADGNRSSPGFVALASIGQSPLNRGASPT
jgi:hypothetical protein